MKKAKENLIAVGFIKEEIPGRMYLNRFNEYVAFEKKGKLGVGRKNDRRVVLEPAFTYIEALPMEYDIFFIVGNEDKYGLYDTTETMIIPVEYKQIVKKNDNPKLFYAYTDIDKNQFDVYWRKGLLAKECKECIVDFESVKVTYVDDTQELFYF